MPILETIRNFFKGDPKGDKAGLLASASQEAYDTESLTPEVAASVKPIDERKDKKLSPSR